ncbi:uncharacterized protein K460DRAFT_19048 [Cucurbitaria berberidis CBS 394.84]|uniref:Uncharacterized protein n=1 Tax=Cucurbitaria berberidis CBS 394.84 TaxID=1168544 RepID=A0A9P4GQ56_9PLEO|nr:uncharacterized protein K460DRAFT_19048 [Cucurbitaria berberidis CBS 394.84]KAF1850653.1 hypothetical protein K460DRAFT_19048 [Cucurbitaria berberidis CBS 394.84]
MAFFGEAFLSLVLGMASVGTCLFAGGYLGGTCSPVYLPSAGASIPNLQAVRAEYHTCHNVNSTGTRRNEPWKHLTS